jgi:hypothetical protein
VDVPGAAEHTVAAIDQLALSSSRHDELRDPGCERRDPAADPAHRAERDVLPDPLVAHVTERRLRRGGCVGAGVALHLAPAGAGHPEELHVVGLAHQRPEVRQDVVERLDGLAGVEVERRHRPQRHLGDHAERSDTHPGHTEPLVTCGDSEHAAVAGDELHPDDGRRQVAEAPARTVGRGRGGAGDGLSIDVAQVRHRQPPARQLAVQLVQPDARLHRHVVTVDREHTIHPVE